MKSRFRLSRFSFPHLFARVLSARVSARGLAVSLLPLAALSACSVAEVSPDVGATTSAGEAKPEMAVRLPAIRLASRGVSAIDTLTQDNADKTVAVSGDVIQRSAVLDGWLYQLRDDSGSVWVLTNNSAPQVEETVIVEGTLRYEPIVVGEIDASGVYIEEKAHQAADE